MKSHETAAGQFIALVNERTGQGQSYESSWQFVRQNNPDLYRRMSTEGAPTVSLGNAAQANEIERNRAVVKQRANQIVNLANAIMVECGYDFEKAYATTKLRHRQLHDEMNEANKRVMSLTNAKRNPAATALATATAPAPSVPPAEAMALHEDFLMMPSTAWDAPEIKKLVGEPEGAAAGMVRQAFDREVYNLKPAAFAKLLDVAAKVAASLFNGDVEQARATLAARLPAIARAAVAGVAPAKDEEMAKLLNVPA